MPEESTLDALDDIDRAGTAPLPFSRAQTFQCDGGRSRAAFLVNPRYQASDDLEIFKDTIAKTETFYDELKRETWRHARKLKGSLSKEELTHRPKLSSFAELVPSIHPSKRGRKGSLSSGQSRAGSGDESSVSKFSMMRSRSNSRQPRFTLEVNHKKEIERIMKENYKLAKAAIIKARPTVPLKRDTSSRTVCLS